MLDLAARRAQKHRLDADSHRRDARATRRNDGGDADADGCHWHWAFSDVTEYEYAVYWVGTAAAGGYDVMGDPTVEQNLAFALDIEFERYDPEGYCPTE